MAAFMLGPLPEDTQTMSVAAVWEGEPGLRPKDEAGRPGDCCRMLLAANTSCLAAGAQARVLLRAWGTPARSDVGTSQVVVLLMCWANLNFAFIAGLLSEGEGFQEKLSTPDRSCVSRGAPSAAVSRYA